LIRCRDLSVERRGRLLLDGVTLELKRGERWLLWGANGAGKTTLARVLAGLLPPDGGELSWDESLTPPLPLLFQDPDAQIAAATVRDEVALGARAPGEPSIGRGEPGPAGRRLAKALARFRLDALARRNPHSLSGGEKRRLNLAAVSVLESPVLILDEPELHLDPAAWTEWTVLLDERVAGEGLTLLEICLVPERALAADGLAVLHEGRLVAAGPPEDVYRDLRGADLPLPRVPVWEDGPVPSRQAEAPARREKAGGVAPGDVTPLLAATELRLERPGGGPRVLDGASLELRAGERVLVAGGNGSGKTSLLLLLAGLADPDGGRIERTPPAGFGAPTAMAFQEPERSCFAETVAGELGFGLARLGVGEPLRSERVDGALRAMGLAPERYRDRDPFRLSLGEQRRVALASLLALEPALLLLDEPAAGLDEEGRALLVEALSASPAAIVWADCREPIGCEDLFERRLRLEGGSLRSWEGGTT